MLIVAAVVACTIPLAGCISWFLPPTVSSTSTPTMEDVAADLEPYYHQVLVWSSCGDLQCATASAPLDWTDPARDSIDLALVRQPATSSNRLGSLLVNPGGPGGSGVDFIRNSLDYATDDRLQASYDIVGFDPRGVGASSAVSCYDDSRELDAYLYDIPPGAIGSDEWIAAVAESNKTFGASCLEHTGELLDFVDTISAARDLDLLRAILGDEKLNYLGYSYGTLLGATFADLYPQHTGRMVLDGAVDPASTNFDVTLTQAKGFEHALRNYLATCLDGSDCPFSGTVDQAMEDIRTLLDTLDANPIAASDGRRLGSGAMFYAIILPLYNEGNWIYLTQLFTDVLSGNADTAFSLADSYNSRNPDGTYADNQTEAFISINCLDYAADDDPATMQAEAQQLRDEAPVFGPQMSYGGIGCAQWPFLSTREPHEIHAEGSADIVVVGTTNDPATPYVWAQNMAGQLQHGHLVTYDGEGHTAYNKSNDCVNQAVDDFLVDGTVPASDPMC
jgi:pimeloyl-ACP methyl ester carboxylesterase